MKRTACPICGRAMTGEPDQWPAYPFCSKRCRLIDLGNWLSEDYAIPAAEQDPEDEPSPRKPAD